MPLGFSVSSRACFGCKTCSVACANEKMLRPGVVLRRVRAFAWEGKGGRGQAFVSMACNHCDDPVCLKNCPVRAYSKRADGLVVQDHSLCIGCQTCVTLCPFHAPVYDEGDSTTYKCDGCADRLALGQLPVCQASCPSANIALGEYDDVLVLRANSIDIREMVETGPLYRLEPDPDLVDDLQAVMADIDGNEFVVDLGVEESMHR